MTDAPALRLLSVHAHPDDEASKGAALVARYVGEGAHATLVCCTGGELGSILNPAMDRPEVVENLPEVRAKELERSAQIIGYQRVDMLGYKDSGMPDMPENADPANFANAPLDDAVLRLVRIIRRDRPQVLLTYDEEQGHYPHPDHLRTHEISVHAFDRAGDPDWFPEAGDPWQPSKMYYTTWARARIEATHQKMLELGIESPFPTDWFDRPNLDHRITTKVDVGAFLHIRDEALLAHATQVDPNEKFWFGLTPQIAAATYPWDDYILARSTIDTDLPEDDLFAGLR